MLEAAGEPSKSVILPISHTELRVKSEMFTLQKTATDFQRVILTVYAGYTTKNVRSWTILLDSVTLEMLKRLHS
ncbi:MAG: hypothetical protein D6690_05020 [Nitrospirae bacterium]|nr:MAG: hypothetical protein D6690_05020 [Nitrospirota bacterium]